MRLTLKNKRTRQGSYIKPLGLTKCISKLSAESLSFVIEGNLRFNNLKKHHLKILSEEMSEKEFIIRKPDDWHLHLRDGEMLASVIQHSAANFERAIIMPNLVPPVLTTDDAIAYKERINQVLSLIHI